jgi:hypothetical protein
MFWAVSGGAIKVRCRPRVTQHDGGTVSIQLRDRGRLWDTVRRKRTVWRLPIAVGGFKLT